MATFTAANASVAVNMVDFFRWAPPSPLTIDFIIFNSSQTKAEVETVGGGAPGGDLVLSYVGTGFTESAIVPTGGTFTSVTLKEADIEIGTISGITRTGNFAEIVTNDAYRILIGNDFITGSEQGDTLFTGDGGNDTVFGGSGNDTIFMTAVSGAPTHSIDGGIGNDTISLINNFYSAAKTLDLRSATVQSIEGFDFVDAGLTVILNSSQLKAASFSPSSTIDGTGVLHVVENLAGILDLSALKVAATVSVVVDGTGGTDLISGTKVADTLRAGAGRDTVNGNGGDDIFEVTGAEAQFDAMNGGAGNDTLRVAGTADVTLNGFNATVQSIEVWTGNFGFLLGNGNANVFDLSGLASMSRLSRVDGEGGDDTIVGSAFVDALGGGAGNDTINGGAGNDTLVGELGGDHLTGGIGADDFLFFAAAEIGKKKGLRDVITDFTLGQDTLDFSRMDANGAKKGFKAFKFLKHEGSDFTHKAGQLSWEQVDKKGTANDVTLVKGDIDGNGKADFQLELTGLIDLHKADFVL